MPTGMREPLSEGRPRSILRIPSPFTYQSSRKAI
jgi:hypothetical protein